VIPCCRRWLPVLLALALLLAASARDSCAAAQAAPDHLVAMLRRMDVFLHSEELAGITRDPRFELNPTEFARLSVVCQLLGYLELDRSIPETRKHRTDIVERADFLVQHFDVIHNGSASDGMLGYALLGAWEATGDARYLAKAQEIVENSKQLHGYEVTLNWGLMSGMALARAYRTSGDVTALAQLDRIVASLDAYVLPDGSFPHICEGKPDVHYTGWITMELIAIARELGDPERMARALRSTEFLAARVTPSGETEYSGPCAVCPGTVGTYWSLGAGCPYDYDTRGWVNELGYLALAFDEAGDTRYGAVMRFLAEHEDHGAFPDKWAYFLAPEDPAYAWGSASRSVVRTSILFWTLACVLSNRDHPGAGRQTAALTSATPDAAIAETADPPLRLSWDPAGSALHFGLASPATLGLAIYDVRGRCVRHVFEGGETAGAHSAPWDRRDDRGAAVAPGVYFAHLVTAERSESVRLALAR
jgi:hypothetical protein